MLGGYEYRVIEECIEYILLRVWRMFRKMRAVVSVDLEGVILVDGRQVDL